MKHIISVSSFFALLVFFAAGCGGEEKKMVEASSAADYFNKTHDVSLMLPGGRFKEGSAKDVAEGKIQLEDFIGKKYEATYTKEGKEYKFGDITPLKK